ncbi:MAG: hypothetical protein HYY06_22935 [Deltaproteobacteria bacterium]|nr:hypothetical protein [Deltaproteobacteria bacterium]
MVPLEAPRLVRIASDPRIREARIVETPLGAVVAWTSDRGVSIARIVVP